MSQTTDDKKEGVDVREVERALRGGRDKTLTSGQDPKDGKEWQEIDPATGQQKAYIVLTDDELAQGFVRPLRYAYKHLKCGAVTQMGHSIAASYAVDPHMYSATFCCTCRGHFSVGEDGEFEWDGTDERVGT